MRGHFQFAVILVVTFGYQKAHSTSNRSTCQLVLQQTGYHTMQALFVEFVRNLRSLGVNRQTVERLIEMERDTDFDPLGDVLTGADQTPDSLSVRRLVRLYEEFTKPVDLTAAELIKRDNSDLAAMVGEVTGIQDDYHRQHTLYSRAQNPVSAPPEVEINTQNIASAVSYYLKGATIVETGEPSIFFPDILDNTLPWLPSTGRPPLNQGRARAWEGTFEGYTFKANTTNGERFMATDFSSQPVEANQRKKRLPFDILNDGSRGNTPQKDIFSVFVNIPQDQSFPAELRTLLERAKMAGATELKASVVSRYQLNDRVIVHFDDMEAALRFAETTIKDLKTRKFSGDVPPLTYQFGKSPVAFGVHTGKIDQRQRASQVLADAAKLFKTESNRGDLTRRYLLFHGIDPSSWLPLDYATTYKARLEALSRQSN